MSHNLCDILCACRELFGDDVEISPQFVDYLQPEGVKAAFRTRAKQTHPDLVVSERVAGTFAEDFIKTRDAYELLTEYFIYREQGKGSGGEFHPSTFDQTGGWQRRQPPQGGMVYSGSVPARKHLLGRYLYYRGIITYRTLLDAITWQRTTNLPMGSVASDWGWLSPPDIRRILGSQMPGLFGESAIRLGLLTPLQVGTLLMHQQTSRQKIGQYFIQYQLLDPADLHELLRDFRLHNLRHS